jgi:uncharacterized membrane-anchored protein YjiN (DUF445 family)
MTSTSSLPALRSEAARQQRLVITKRRATALLVVMAAVFAAALALESRAPWLGYVQAAAEASLVGGLADWFAVTALFRHPLGLPIPHTAIIVERKEQFAQTLGDFIQESFLTPEVIVQRLRASAVVPRLADWLADESNASRVAAELADGAVALTDLVRDEDVHDTIEDFLREKALTLPVAPLAGKGLRMLTDQGRHQQVLDVILRELDGYLATHGAELRNRLGDKSPWWLPLAVEDRIFERLVEGAHLLIQEMLVEKEHHLRAQFDARLKVFIDDLETSPEYRAKGEQLMHELVEQPEVRALVASLWEDAKAQLRMQASDPDSELRRRLGDAILAIGARLRDDPALAAKVQDGLESGVVYVAGRFDGEIASLVSGTIEKWDGNETARRLELLLGPDLQYIRINGTVVGGAVGLVLYTIAQLAG